METICTGRRTRFLEMKCPTTHCFQAQGSNKKRLLLLLMFTQANVFWPAVILSLSPTKYEHSRRKNRLPASYRWHNVWLKCSHDEKWLIVESSLFWFRLSPAMCGEKEKKKNQLLGATTSLANKSLLCSAWDRRNRTSMMGTLMHYDHRGDSPVDAQIHSPWRVRLNLKSKFIWNIISKSVANPPGYAALCTRSISIHSIYFVCVASCCVSMATLSKVQKIKKIK